MGRSLLLIIIFCALKTNAQTYQINFTGTGESTSVTTVKVENLATGAVLTLNGSDILRLTVTTGVNLIDYGQSSQMKIYPNPMIHNSTLEFFPPVPGNAIISVYEITGKPVLQVQSYLNNGRQEFRFSGLNIGVFLIIIKGDGYQLSGKLLSNGKSNGIISIAKVSNNIQSVDEKKSTMNLNGIQAIVDMVYLTGDRLKFTGISGNYSTVKTDIPAGDKTITFNLIACTDGDKNNYPVVMIGTQVWMAENLKTTKYRNGDLIGTTTPATLDISGENTPSYQWAYNGNESNVATYGRLYNWYAISDIRKVCPISWHVPTFDEMTSLTTSLGGEDIGNVTGGKLKETGTIHWLSPNIGATNESGFTASPGGSRYNGSIFGNLGYDCTLRSSSEYGTDNAWNKLLTNSGSSVTSNAVDKKHGFSVRCIKDN